MHMPARLCCQPRLDLGMLVTAIVVHDAVHVEIGWHRLVDLAQERQELLMPVARFAVASTAPLSTFRAANSVVVPWRT
jgi:hypothetical protein